MMTETQRRIKAYKAALPGLWERVVAVALLLAMSASMLASASFAWLTISRRPEVTGVSTTVAANGNLEIALADNVATRTPPGESKVGDSSAAEGQSVTKSNITWGNLVNLSDPAYGLEHMVLRPAQLRPATLLDTPLYGAVYQDDGRISQLSGNFAYTTWTPPQGNLSGSFDVSDKYGVRAIASTVRNAEGEELRYMELLEKAENTNQEAANLYAGIAQNDDYMNSLAYLMGTYMTAQLNDSDPTLEAKHVDNLKAMYGVFVQAYNKEAEAIAHLINLQLWINYRDDKETGLPNYTEYTGEDVINASSNLTAFESTLKKEGVILTQLGQFLTDRNTIITDKATLDALTGTLTWSTSGISTIVDHLVTVSSCTLDGTPIGNIGVSNAMSYLDGGTHDAVITNGLLKRFEERTGGHIVYKGLKISAKYYITVSINANISTNADTSTFYFLQDQKKVEANRPEEFEGKEVAQDTYGLAVDLWVRTNAANSYLTLEGNVLTTSHNEPVMGRDANGNSVELYILTLEPEEETTPAESSDPNTPAAQADDLPDNIPLTYDMDVYKVVNEDQTETWYSYDRHTPVTEEEWNARVGEPRQKMEEIIEIIGYEGENRVWENNSMLTADSTTQGSGSCYVYYADTPEDQARSLKLLEAFNVAFVDGNGRMLTSAYMDTTQAYVDSGRVTVPLVLDSTKSLTYTGAGGADAYAIMALEQNVPTWITAIVYLDGTKLNNQDVLAASDIQGQLNIQFGTTFDMDPISNEALEAQERKVNATVTPTTLEWTDDPADMTTNVKVVVEGDQPQNVTAFFLRQISQTQGSREQEMTLTQDPATGEWTTDYTFTAPGTYILRTVRLDGQDYVLKNPQTVTVAGFTVRSLTCQQANAERHVHIMSAAGSSTVNLELQFAAADSGRMPSTVQGRYINDDTGAAVNVDFTLNGTNQIWSGSATFLTSGNYTMQYLIVDGEYMELPENMHQTASATLGMRVTIYSNEPREFLYIPTQMEEDGTDELDVEVIITDNAGKEMMGMSNAKLVYGHRGSSVNTMDANLTWSGSSYTGKLPVDAPGVWMFNNVTVNGNVLSNAVDAPVFTVKSTTPPTYYSHTTEGYQYAPNNNAYMTAQIFDSDTAKQVTATLVNDYGETHTVVGTANQNMGEAPNGKTYTTWRFLIPTREATGNQEGNWQLTELQLTGVYDTNGNEYDADRPLIFDVSGTKNVTKVVNKMHITMPEGMSKTFGKDASGNVTGTFMQSYADAISGLSVSILDYEGEPIRDITDVVLAVTYQTGTSSTYGGFTSSNLSNQTEGAYFNLALKDQGNGTYAQEGSETLIYAGEYRSTLRFSFNGQKYSTANETGSTQITAPANMPTFSVWSKAPTVSITAISNPTGTFSADTNTSGSIDDTRSSESRSSGSGCSATTEYRCYFTTNSSHKTNYSNSTTATKAMVYFVCDHTNTSPYGHTGWYDLELVAIAAAVDNRDYHQYTQPTVTITLSGLGNGTGATLNFTPATAGMNEVYLYTGGGTTGQTTGYSWTADGAVLRYVGSFTDAGNSNNDSKIAARELKATQLELTDSSGNKYIVPVNITIDNPF